MYSISWCSGIPCYIYYIFPKWPNHLACLFHHRRKRHWFVVWNIFNVSIYCESSSQLTFIFFRGVGQPPTSISQDGIYWCYLIKKHPEIIHGSSETQLRFVRDRVCLGRACTVANFVEMTEEFGIHSASGIHAESSDGEIPHISMAFIMDGLIWWFIQISWCIICVYI